MHWHMRWRPCGTIRTQNDRGEVVYQATFQPPVADGTSDQPPEVRIPWGSFKLVRGMAWQTMLATSCDADADAV